MATSPESFNFAQEFGKAYHIWTEHHPAPDEQNMTFVGPKGMISYSPRQVAQEIVDQTEFGTGRIEFYLGISEGLGDPTGRKIVDEFRNWKQWWKPSKKS